MLGRRLEPKAYALRTAANFDKCHLFPAMSYGVGRHFCQLVRFFNGTTVQDSATSHTDSEHTAPGLAVTL